MRKLRREKEIQSVRLCEIMEEKNKKKAEMEGKDNEIPRRHGSIETAE